METSMTDPWPLALLPFTKKCRPACGYALLVLVLSMSCCYTTMSYICVWS